MRRTIATFFLLLSLLAANAQTPQEAADQDPRRYTVEMIVFTYAQDIGTGGEVFVGDPAPDETGAGDRAIAGVETVPVKPVRFPETGFARLPRSDFTMTDIWRRLDRLSAYQPVMHFGWTQATYPAELTRDIKLSSLTAPASGFHGAVKLYLSRFLHLVVDLQMEAGNEHAAGTFAPAVSQRFRIQEDRIFRSGELRYFDHPKFGVLAKVTRVEEDDEEATSDARELLGYPAQ